MLRIVGVQRSEACDSEFVLLQNQGGLRAQLRGHLVLSEAALEGAELGQSAYLFRDDALVPPGMYVMLHSGAGSNRWTKTKDGALVYYVFMNRAEPFWSGVSGPLHVLNTQHTFAERRETVRLN